MAAVEKEGVLQPLVARLRSRAEGDVTAAVYAANILEALGMQVSKAAYT